MAIAYRTELISKEDALQRAGRVIQVLFAAQRKFHRILVIAGVDVRVVIEVMFVDVFEETRNETQYWQVKATMLGSNSLLTL